MKALLGDCPVCPNKKRMWPGWCGQWLSDNREIMVQIPVGAHAWVVGAIPALAAGFPTRFPVRGV